MTLYTIYENPKAASFVLSQHAGRRGVLLGIVAAGNTLPSGTVLSLSGGVWGKVSATIGAALPAGILRQRLSSSGSTRGGVILTDDAEVRGSGLIWPPGMTFARHAECLAALAQRGLIARPEGFLELGTWPAAVPEVVWRGAPSPPDAWCFEARTRLDLVRLAGALPTLSGNAVAVTITPAIGAPFAAQLVPAGGDIADEAPTGINDGFGELRLAHDAPALGVGDLIAAARFGAVRVTALHAAAGLATIAAAPPP